MNRWHYFQYLFGIFAQPIVQAVRTGVGQTAADIRPLVLPLLTAWIGSLVILALYGEGEFPVKRIVLWMIKGVVVAVLATAAGYTDVVANTLLAAAGAGNQAGGLGGQPVGPLVFDEMWARVWAVATQAYDAVPSWSMRGMYIMLVVALFVVFSALAIALCFAAYALCFVAVALVAYIGPPFILCALFQHTNRYFVGWLNVAVASIVLQWLLIGLLSLTLTAITPMMREAIAGGGSGGTNLDQVAAQTHIMAEVGILFALEAFFAYEMKNVAFSIAGAVAAEAKVVSSAVHSTLAGWAGAAGSAAGSAASAAGSQLSGDASAGLRSLRVAGAGS